MNIKKREQKEWNEGKIRGCHNYKVHTEKEGRLGVP